MQRVNIIPPAGNRPQRPRIGAGIFTSILVAPLVAIAVAVVWEAAKQGSLGTACIGSAAALICLALPAHFFFGHRLVWILPVLAGSTGLGFACVGVASKNWRLIRWGVPMTVIGFGWFIPLELPDPAHRWLASAKYLFARCPSRKS
jgi:hypothetical protein